MKTFIYVASIFITIFMFSCNKKQVKKDQIEQPAQETSQKIDDVNFSTTDVKETDIRNPEFVSNESIEPIYFDYDKYEITPQYAEILRKNAETLKEKKWTILIEGHCDERGTIEYNLALGQKRANVVKEYYIRLGIPESNIGTISYGEEQPVCNEHNESCWSKNRRAETKVNMGN